MAWGYVPYRGYRAALDLADDRIIADPKSSEAQKEEARDRIAMRQILRNAYQRNGRLSSTTSPHFPLAWGG